MKKLKNIKSKILAELFRNYGVENTIDVTSHEFAVRIGESFVNVQYGITSLLRNGFIMRTEKNRYKLTIKSLTQLLK